MRFGINLGGGDRRGQSREQGLAGRLGKARLAKEMGFHSLWTGAGYLNNDFHPLMLLSRVAAEAQGLELGMVALLPLYHPCGGRRADIYSGRDHRRQICPSSSARLA